MFVTKRGVKVAGDIIQFPFVNSHGLITKKCQYRSHFLWLIVSSIKLAIKDAICETSLHFLHIVLTITLVIVFIWFTQGGKQSVTTITCVMKYACLLSWMNLTT